MICMNVDRFSVSMDPYMGAAVRDAASRAGMSVSAWMAAAAADRLRSDLLEEALDRWEEEDGPFDEAELDAAAAVLEIDEGRRRGGS